MNYSLTFKEDKKTKKNGHSDCLIKNNDKCFFRKCIGTMYIRYNLIDLWFVNKYVDRCLPTQL